ncbi:MAG: hypothetical protein MUE83_00910 [Tabrizicola sp.]|jgi:hypothetical protein|nr:hypothetical protein [Tabrizicola sp.]
MNAAAIAAALLIALLKTTGADRTIMLDYTDTTACEAAANRLEAQVEALGLEDRDQNPVDASPRVVWTCFDTRN